MKRVMSAVTVAAIAASILTGCSKNASSEQGASSSATGPITDSASSGLKPTGTAQVALSDKTHGEAIFNQNCSSCHGVAGVGGGIGPTLKGERARKNYDAAIAWIKNPKAPMPKLYPAPLSESDVDDVAAYVESL